MADRRLVDGVELNFDYCGLCGRNVTAKNRPLKKKVRERVGWGGVSDTGGRENR